MIIDWDEKRVIKLTILVSLIFYFLSFTQIAYCTNECKSSSTVVLLGALGLFVEFADFLSHLLSLISGKSTTFNADLGATITWLSNPTYLFAILIFKYNNKLSLVLSLLSISLILLFMCFNKVIDDEAGHYNLITELKLGYWLWLLSSGILVVGSALIEIKSRKKAERINSK